MLLCPPPIFLPTSCSIPTTRLTGLLFIGLSQVASIVWECLCRGQQCQESAPELKWLLKRFWCTTIQCQTIRILLYFGIVKTCGQKAKSKLNTYCLPFFLQTTEYTELDDSNFDWTCPNTQILFPNDPMYAQSIREPLKNVVDKSCPRGVSRV